MSNATETVAAVAVLSASYEVRLGLTGTDRDTWGTIATFDTGKDAAAFVASMKASTPEDKSLAIVKVEASAAPKVDWRERERQRLDSGEYLPLPGGWSWTVHVENPDHFVHLAQSDKRKIAFTESESSGERDKQKVLSVQEYASRHLSGWEEESRSAFISDVLDGAYEPIFVELGDAEALEEAYVHSHIGPCTSCMSYGAGNFLSVFHPVRVYAMGGDITLAYLQETDADGDIDPEGAIVARCLVWPAEKEYARVYGDVNSVRALRTALEAQGYTHSALHGARIAKVVHSGNCYVMPYLDIGDGGFDDHGDYFSVGGDILGNSTNGLVYVPRSVECDSCGNETHEGDIYSVLVGRHSHEYWCYSCAGSLVRSLESLDRVHPDSAVPAVDRFGVVGHIAKWEADQYDYTLCHDDIYRQDTFECADCSQVFADEDADHEYGDCCETCGEKRRDVSPTSFETLTVSQLEELGQLAFSSIAA